MIYYVFLQEMPITLRKYKDTMEMLKKSPEIDRLVGHSLASAVINKINEEQPK